MKNPVGRLLYNFHDLHEMVKYEEFYEHSYVEEFHANCSASKTRNRFSSSKKLEICEYYATHKNYRKTARRDFLVFKIQLLGEYTTQLHPKRSTRSNSLVLKKISISRETKKEQESLYLIQ